MADESPLDRFKSALTGASRAISGDPELELAWTADAPALTGNTMRVPMPGRSVPAGAAAEARGYADSFALRLRHHNEALHARNAPTEFSARACYDAVERVRYEALGARDFAGVGGNLDAALTATIDADPIVGAVRADEVPVQTAIALLLRERLTGREIPKRARSGVELVRNWIEAKAGKDFDSLASAVDDQQAFQHLALGMLEHLELTHNEEMEPEPNDPDDQDGESETEDDEDGGDAGEEQEPSEVAAQPTVTRPGTRAAKARPTTSPTTAT